MTNAQNLANAGGQTASQIGSPDAGSISMSPDIWSMIGKLGAGMLANSTARGRKPGFGEALAGGMANASESMDLMAKYKHDEELRKRKLAEYSRLWETINRN